MERLLNRPIILHQSHSRGNYNSLDPGLLEDRKFQMKLDKLCTKLRENRDLLFEDPVSPIKPVSKQIVGGYSSSRTTLRKVFQTKKRSVQLDPRKKLFDGENIPSRAITRVNFNGKRFNVPKGIDFFTKIKELRGPTQPKTYFPVEGGRSIISHTDKLGINTHNRALSSQTIHSNLICHSHSIGGAKSVATNINPIIKTGIRQSAAKVNLLQKTNTSRNQIRMSNTGILKKLGTAGISKKPNSAMLGNQMPKLLSADELWKTNTRPSQDKQRYPQGGPMRNTPNYQTANSPKLAKRSTNNMVIDYIHQTASTARESRNIRNSFQKGGTSTEKTIMKWMENEFVDFDYNEETKELTYRNQSPLGLHKTYLTLSTERLSIKNNDLCLKYLTDHQIYPKLLLPLETGIAGGEQITFYLKTAMSYIDLKQFKMAQLTLEESLKTYRNEYQLRFNYGFVLIILHQYTKSHTIFRELLIENPSHPYIFHNLLYSLVRGYRYKEATEYKFHSKHLMYVQEENQTAIFRMFGYSEQNIRAESPGFPPKSPGFSPKSPKSPKFPESPPQILQEIYKPSDLPEYMDSLQRFNSLDQSPKKRNVISKLYNNRKNPKNIAKSPPHSGYESNYTEDLYVNAEGGAALDETDGWGGNPGETSTNFEKVGKGHYLSPIKDVSFGGIGPPPVLVGRKSTTFRGRGLEWLRDAQLSTSWAFFEDPDPNIDICTLDNSPQEPPHPDSQGISAPNSQGEKQKPTYIRNQVVSEYLHYKRRHSEELTRGERRNAEAELETEIMFKQCENGLCGGVYEQMPNTPMLLRKKGNKKRPRKTAVKLDARTFQEYQKERWKLNKLFNNLYCHSVLEHTEEEKVNILITLKLHNDQFLKGKTLSKGIKTQKSKLSPNTLSPIRKLVLNDVHIPQHQSRKSFIKADTKNLITRKSQLFHLMRSPKNILGDGYSVKFWEDYRTVDIPNTIVKELGKKGEKGERSIYSEINFEKKTSQFLEFVQVNMIQINERRDYERLLQEVEKVDYVKEYLDNLGKVTHHLLPTSHKGEFVSLSLDEDSIFNQSMKEKTQSIDDMSLMLAKKKLNAIYLLIFYLREKHICKTRRDSSYIMARSALSPLAQGRPINSQEKPKSVSESMMKIIREEMLKKKYSIRPNYELIEKIVRKLYFFASLSELRIIPVLKECDYGFVTKDKFVFEEGDPSGKLYIILRGQVDILKQDAITKRIKHEASLLTGELFGAQTFTRSKDSEREIIHGTTALAQTDLDLLIIPNNSLVDTIYSSVRSDLENKVQRLRECIYFRELDPYTLFILAIKLNTKTFRYGQIIAKQNEHPQEMYIISKGQCKTVFEGVIIRTKEPSEFSKNIAMKTLPKPLHFGMRGYSPDIQDPRIREALPLQPIKSPIHSPRGQIIGLESFQNDVLKGHLTKIGVGSKAQKKLIAYRNHVHFNKLFEGECFCGRALLTVEKLKKFICNYPDVVDVDVLPAKAQKWEEINKYVTLTAEELEDQYQALTQSQLSVIADSSIVEILALSIEMKSYLSDEIQQAINKTLLERLFIDTDRPFKQNSEVNSILKQEKKWDDYKQNLEQMYLKDFIGPWQPGK